MRRFLLLLATLLIAAQWKKDFPRNEDVKKTDSTLVLKNTSLDIPPMNWRRM